MKDFDIFLINIVVFMIGLSLVFDQKVMLLVCVWLLLILLTAVFWYRYTLKRLSFNRQLSMTHIFPETSVTMQTQLVNQKLLPLARVDVFDEFPAAIQVKEVALIPGGRPGKKILLRSVSLGWYEVLHQAYTLHVKQRGLYEWGPVEINTSDPFGFFVSTGKLQAPSRLVVYPHLLADAQIPPTLRNMFGAQATRSSLHADPVQTIGIREYQVGDPFKMIHWPATARHGSLQTRISQPATTLEWMCFIDINTFPHVWMGVNPQRAEWIISLAATFCTKLLRQGHKVGIATNATVSGKNATHLAPSNHPEQNRRVLEALAQMNIYAAVDLSRLVLRTRSQLVQGTTLVVISALIDPMLVTLMADFGRRGFPIVWLHTSPEPPKLPRAVCIHVPEVQL